MAPKKPKEKGASFEAQLARLTELTERLESGSLPLEEALKAYEEGMAISRQLVTQLDAAEKRIEILSGVGDAAHAAPFEEDGAPVNAGGGDDGDGP